MDNERIQYDAFISYRHLPLDKYVAKTLHRTLESFVLPKRLREDGKRDRIRRVFRDRDELPLSNNLSEPIEIAIENSDYMIVICTPKLKESEWCRREIETFKSLHGQDRIMAVLAEGEPVDSFPLELLVEEHEEVTKNGETVIIKRNVEPLAADVRGKSKREIRKKIEEESLRILAPIFGVTYDTLKQRHRERRLKKIITMSSIAASVFLIFGLISGAMAVKINNQARKISENYSRVLAESALQTYSKGLVEEALKIAGQATDYDENSDTKRAINIITNKYTAEGMLVADYSVNIGTGISSMLLSPDEKSLAIFDNLGRMLIMDAATGEINMIEREYGSAINSRNNALFLDTNRLLYCSNGETRVYYIDKKENRVIKDNYGSYFGNYCYDKEKGVLYGMYDGHLAAIDSESYETRFDIEMDVESDSVAAVSEDGRRLMVAGVLKDDFKASYYIVDTDNGNVISTSENAGGMVVKIISAEGRFYESFTEINPDADCTTSYIAAISEDSGEILWISDPNSAVNMDLSYVEKGLIYTVSTNGPATLNAEDGKRLYTTFPESTVISYGGENGNYYCITRNGVIYSYDVFSGNCNLMNEYAVSPTLDVQNAVITENCIFVNFQGTDYLTAYKPYHSDSNIMIPEDFDWEDGIEKFDNTTLSYYSWNETIAAKCTDGTTTMYSSPDQKYILEYNLTDSAIRVYSNGSAEPIGSINVETGLVTSAFFSDDNRYIGVTKLNGELLVFSNDDYCLIKSLPKDFTYVNRMLNVDGRFYIIDSMYATYIVDEQMNELFKYNKSVDYAALGYDSNSKSLLMECKNGEYEILLEK